MNYLKQNKSYKKIYGDKPPLVITPWKSWGENEKVKIFLSKLLNVIHYTMRPIIIWACTTIKNLNLNWRKEDLKRQLKLIKNVLVI